MSKNSGDGDGEGDDDKVVAAAAAAAAPNSPPILTSSSDNLSEEIYTSYTCDDSKLSFATNSNENSHKSSNDNGDDGDNDDDGDDDDEDEEDDRGDEDEKDSSVTSEYLSDESDYDIDDDDHYNNNRMPLLKYNRIGGSIPRQRPTSTEPTSRRTGTTTETDTTENEESESGNKMVGRPFQIPCRCSALGRVVIRPSSGRAADSLGSLASNIASNINANMVQDDPTGSERASKRDSDENGGCGGAGGENNDDDNNNLLLTTKSRYFTVLAMGLQGGTIMLVDAKSGKEICPSDDLKVQTSHGGGSKPFIVALSFDSGATHLAALTSDGNVAIFELKYGLGNGKGKNSGLKSSASNFTRTTSFASNFVDLQRPEQKLFTSFLSRLAGDDTASSSVPTSNVERAGDGGEGRSDSNDDDNDQSSSMSEVTLYLTQPVSTARFTYTNSGSSSVKATCLALDPAYSKKREKCVIVGFSNGKLIYTKRSSHGGISSSSGGIGGVMGSLLQPKRHDMDLYQSVGVDWIEAISWRGSFIAWADGSGIKIFDVDAMQRVAHIDKPTGARASLYPHISSLKPRMVFERNDSLMICWGDCLMNMTINGAEDVDARSDGKNNRISVRCVMAWELDCVACDCQPVDAEYVAVLGVTSSEKNMISEEQKVQDNGTSSPAIENLDHFIELQMIRRSDGSVISSDVLPLSLPRMQALTQRPCTSDFSLMSSFATPRMNNFFEGDNEEIAEEISSGVGGEVDIQNIIMNTMVSPLNEEKPKKEFVDPHTKWSIESYRRAVVDEDLDDDSIESDVSDDSDDYGFLFKGIKPAICSAEMLMNVPTMVITSSSDAVLTQVRDVDDSVEYAGGSSKHALALKHGLNYRQMLRRYEINDLINNFFTAILNPNNQNEDTEQRRILSVRRLTLAAKSTTVLLGTNMALWEKWIHKFEQIPGGLLLLRPYVPVRDPKLPSQSYNNIICTIFSEIEEMMVKGTDDSNVFLSSVHDNAADLFFEALSGWGPISSLRDRLKVHRTAIEELDESSQNCQLRLLHEAASALSSRMKQSAASYLLYERDQRGQDLESMGFNPNSSLIPAGVSADALFDIQDLKIFFEERLKDYVEGFQPQFYQTKALILEAQANIYFMEGDFQHALEAYLSIGDLLIADTVSLVEDAAIESVIGEKRLDVDTVGNAGTGRYHHILALIQSHDLHRCLLQMHDNDPSSTPPLVSLMCLVGLHRCSIFLIKHCVLPKRKEEGGSTNSIHSLPIDKVAHQLKTNPKILLWFLHTILNERKEIYVTFPNTAVPSKSVTDLHRIHFNLYVNLVKSDKSDRMKKLSDIPSFEEYSEESCLLTFLKVALPHGGIRSGDVRRRLEDCRCGILSSEKSGSKNKNAIVDLKYPRLFAHELAYVIERSGSGTEEDAIIILNLYLEGLVSLPHAVEYTMRNLTHQSMLWDTLISYCLNTKENNIDNSKGRLFGSLLEVAARSGADLAYLVSKIPVKLRIDGIRHRLVAAISDYQTKLTIHETACEILSNEKVGLLRERCHRSRRGTRVDLYSQSQSLTPESQEDNDTMNIILKPWQEGRARLASKRKRRKAKRLVKGNEIGMNLPSLEIR